MCVVGAAQTYSTLSRVFPRIARRVLSPGTAGADAGAPFSLSRRREPAPRAEARGPAAAAADRTRTSRSKALQTPPPPAPEPMRYGDDTEIPEEDLEFNPDATDINKVFVEPPPSPKFTAATGTFKAIRMEAEDAARVEEELDPDRRARDPRARSRTVSIPSTPRWMWRSTRTCSPPWRT